MKPERRYLTPSYELLTEQKQGYKKRVQDIMTQRAMLYQWVQFENRLVFRGIQCSDLGLTSWQIPPMQKQTLTSWIQTTNIDYRLIGIYKVIPLSVTPTVNRLVIKLGHTLTYDCEIDKLYNLLPIIQRLKTIEEKAPGWVKTYFEGIDQVRMEGYLSEPVLIGNEEFQVEVSTKCDLEGQEELVLDGFVLERVGQVIA